MKLKKVLAAAMISLLATTALVGCGSDKKNADTGKKVQIEYWHVAAGTADVYQCRGWQ